MKPSDDDKDEWLICLATSELRNYWIKSFSARNELSIFTKDESGVDLKMAEMSASSLNNQINLAIKKNIKSY